MFTPASYFHALQGGAEKPPFLHLLLLLPPPAPPPVSVTKKDAEEDNLESLGLRAQEQAGLPSFPLLPETRPNIPVLSSQLPLGGRKTTMFFLSLQMCLVGTNLNQFKMLLFKTV